MSRRKRFVSLTEEEYTNLQKEQKNGKKATYRQRCHYILLSSRGKSIDEISEIYQVNRVSITKWINRYETEGLSGLHTAKGRGRPPIIRMDNESEIKKIEDWVEESPQNLKPVLVKIKENLNKQMSKRTLSRFLKKKVALETLS